MRIAVFGTGGVGGYFGGRLAQAGYEVIFIARGEHLRALQAHGLRIDSIKGDFHLYPIFATDNLSRVGEVDYVLMAVKAWQVPDAALALRPVLGAQTAVVPLNNGVEAPAQLSTAIGPGHVLGGLCRISSLIAAPGYIRHVGIEPYVAFGELDGSYSQRAERLRQAFERSDVRAEVPQDIQAAMWGKFVFIAAISGLGAITRAPLGVIRQVPDTRRMLLEALQEIVNLAQANGVALPAEAAAQTLAAIDQMPGGVTASMQRDIMEGKPSELDSQNGAVVRMGLESGVPTPTHTFIYHCLLPQEQKARGEIDF